MLTLEAVQKLVPKQQRTLITKEFLNRIERSVKRHDEAEEIKKNYISYLHVLKTGRYRMDDYLNAVTYVTFKLLNYTNINAYAATFPERYARITRDKGQVDAYASLYNSNKLVNEIYAQTVIPTHILNAPLHQEALSTLAGVIKDPDIKGLVKVKACEAILEYTKAPTIIESKLTIGIEQQQTISDLRQVTEQLADTLKVALQEGKTNLRHVADMNIVDVDEYEEVDEEEEVPAKEWSI